MANVIQSIVIALLGAGIIFVAFTLGSQYIKNEAIDKCLSAGRDQFERDGHTLTGPDGYWYEYCLEQKGIN